MIKEADNDIFVNKYLYTPKDKMPPINELYDADRYYSLLEKIDSSDIPDDVKYFLRLAASRFIRYYFKRIADYYCATDPKIQRLFETTKLVLIDEDHKLENAVFKLNKRIEEIRSEIHQEDSNS